ncbi:MAG TPA: Gfo/Idh/MocA family oxidoreductase, partial [Usitatibacter sp.]|nr:Gfo/Idh/MocA family oxidoreductase [Usitatibacter sp.]
MRARRNGATIRYAVVGQGYIAQAAVLPAFRHARRNSRLAAIVSGDAAKRKALSRRYDVPAYSYEDFERCLDEARVDAVYIALPNHLHREWSVRSARLGRHVLCEKPLAVRARDCQAMIGACRRAGVKLMTAYRLHFERATLSAIEAVKGDRIGEAKLFVSSFTNDVKPPNIRLEADGGGGTFYDIGIYCINAARHLFEAEPEEAFAMTTAPKKGSTVEESASAMLRFPGDRLATFCLSFGTDKTSEYRIVGTRGSLRVEPGYELARGLAHHYKRGSAETDVAYGKRDQFAPELLYFSDCILEDREPQPSGEEGLADVRVIEALYRSARTGRAVKLAPRPMRTQPSPRN